jgi:hypothetical protein
MKVLSGIEGDASRIGEADSRGRELQDGDHADRIPAAIRFSSAIQDLVGSGAKPEAAAIAPERCDPS